MKFTNVTVIIPVPPEKDASVVIESLKKVDYPKEKIEVLIAEGKQPAKQRNEAIRIAKGDILFFFDDDTLLEPEIIKQMLKCYSDDKVAIVGGPNLTPPSDSFLQKCFGYVMGSYFGAAGMRTRYKPRGELRDATEKDLILCNLSARRSILEKESFAENLYPNEENELFNRLRKKGYKLIYNPAATAYHSRRPTIRSFLRQNFSYGRGRAEQILIQPASFEPLFLAPTLFTLYLLSLLAVRSPLYLTPLILYLLVCTVSSLSIAVRQKDPRLLLVLPWIFPMVHVPYGVGFVYGFIKKALPSRKYGGDVKVRKIML